MMKRILYLFVLLAIVSCEDVYIADLNKTADMLVVEANITNDPAMNKITLSTTRDFYDELYSPKITGAQVWLVDENGNEIYAQEEGNGDYSLDFSAVVGRKYQLKIDAEGKQYESSFEVMPELPVIDSFSLVTDTIDTYFYSATGKPYKKKAMGNRVLVDLPLNENLSHYMFQTTLILEYIIYNDALVIPPIPPIYGWKKIKSNTTFNIAGPPKFGDHSDISEHLLFFTENNLYPYLTTEVLVYDPVMVGWIMILDQFGISERTYRFYETLNAQLEAEGKLFDPVFPQIQGNIKCISNPEETVVGYFELSSYQQTRYFLSSGIGQEIFYYQFDEVNVIPYNGEIQQIEPPYFWEYPMKPGRDLNQHN